MPFAGGTLAPPEPLAPIGCATVQSLQANDSDARVVEKAAKLLPHSNTWQRMETTFLIHDRPNTFTSAEWGNGKE